MLLLGKLMTRMPIKLKCLSTPENLFDMKSNVKIVDQLQQLILDYKKSNDGNEKSSLTKANELYNKLLSDGTIQKREYSLISNEEAFILSTKFNGYA